MICPPHHIIAMYRPSYLSRCIVCSSMTVSVTIGLRTKRHACRKDKGRHKCDEYCEEASASNYITRQNKIFQCIIGRETANIVH